MIYVLIYTAPESTFVIEGLPIHSAQGPLGEGTPPLRWPGVHLAADLVVLPVAGCHVSPDQRCASGRKSEQISPSREKQVAWSP